MPAPQTMPSKLFFSIVCLSVVSAVGGFAGLLQAGIVHPWGVHVTTRPSPADAGLVLLYISLTGLFFLGASFIGLQDASTSAIKGARECKSAVVINALSAAVVVSAFAVFQIGGFSEKYLLPLFSLHPPATALILGAPMLVLPIILLVLGSFMWHRVHSKFLEGLSEGSAAEVLTAKIIPSDRERSGFSKEKDGEPTPVQQNGATSPDSVPSISHTDEGTDSGQKLDVRTPDSVHQDRS